MRNSMAAPKFIAILSVFSILACRRVDGTVGTAPINDTASLLEKACFMAAEGAYMPGASPLGEKGKDSIVLTSHSVSLQSLRENEALKKFIIIPGDSVCSFLSSNKRSLRKNYLCVSTFEKSDTGYFVKMESLPCEKYGGGGTLGLCFKIVGDSIIIVCQGASSLN